jgi:hypothetical protein
MVSIAVLNEGIPTLLFWLSATGAQRASDRSPAPAPSGPSQAEEFSATAPVYDISGLSGAVGHA